MVLSASLPMGCTKDNVETEEAVTPPKENKSAAAGQSPSTSLTQPALAVATVASLISVRDVMVREPERFKKVLCSDSKFYDLEYENGRFSLAAEPLSVCVLMADTKELKPIGICGDDNCESSAVSECPEPQKKELLKAFADEQTVRRCWNIGSFAPLQFTVLMTKIGQSCQAQTLAKTPKGWLQLNTIDGTFETRKTATAEGTGCWWEAGANFSYEGDWFGQQKRVLPIMAFQKQGGLYALLRSSWSGSENFQLFRLDGEKALEIESFAESFKDPSPDPLPAPAIVPEEKSKPKGKAKSKGKAKKGKSAAVSQPNPESGNSDTFSSSSPAPGEESASPLDQQPVQESAPEVETAPATSAGDSKGPSNPAQAPVPLPDEDKGVSPLEEKP